MQGANVPAPVANEIWSMIGTNVVLITLDYYLALQFWADTVIRDRAFFDAHVTIKCYTVRLRYLETPQMEWVEKQGGHA